MTETSKEIGVSQLFPANMSTQRITTTLLDGKFFASWSHSVKLFLGTRGMTGWLFGSKKKPPTSDAAALEKWNQENCMILGGLLNSMEPRLYTMFMYHKDVAGLWTRLTQMYAHSRNDARIYELHREVSHATQASLGLSVSDYFAYLQCRWEELAHYETLDDFDETHAKLVMDRLEKHHTYQFLMGLKPEFESTRNMILNTSPLPSLFDAYAMVDSHEKRRLLPTEYVAPNTAPVVASPTLSDQMAFAARSKPSSGRYICSHCNRKGHTADRCYRLHPELRPQNNPVNRGSSSAPLRTAAVVDAPPTSSSLDLSQLQNQIEMMQQALGSLMQQKSPQPTISTSSSSTAMAAKGTPHVLLSHRSPMSWILDSGANDHMTGPEFEEDFWYGP